MVWTEYIKRWKRDQIFQLKAFGMVIDWTVFVYLVIPIIIAMIVIDYRLWHSPPQWTTIIPFELIGLLFFFAAQSFSIRTYVEQADELFVVQKGGYLQSLLQCGKYFALLKSALFIGVILLYLWPVFTLGYHFPGFQIFILYAYVFLWSFFLSLASRWFFLRRMMWRRRLFSLAAFVLYGIGIYSLFTVSVLICSIALVIAGITAVLFKKEQKPLSYFFAEAERERHEKWKWASLLMTQSGEFEGIRKNRKFPLLNKQSRPIFSERIPDKVIAEMYWKWLIRKGKNLKFTLYFTFVSFYAETLLPSKIKFIVLVFIVFAGYAIQNGMWKAFTSHSFTKNMGDFQDTSVRKGKKRALLVTWLLPFGLVALWTLFLVLFNLEFAIRPTLR